MKTLMCSSQFRTKLLVLVFLISRGLGFYSANSFSIPDSGPRSRAGNWKVVLVYFLGDLCILLSLQILENIFSISLLVFIKWKETHMVDQGWLLLLGACGVVHCFGFILCFPFLNIKFWVETSPNLSQGASS